MVQCTIIVYTSSNKAYNALNLINKGSYMKRVIRTSSGRLDDVCMSDIDRARAKTYLRGVELVVDLVWRAAAQILPFTDERRVKSTCTRPA